MKRPEWWPAWTDYPHGALSNTQARELSGYVVALEEQKQELLVALQNLAYYEARISPPPYDHACRWCGDCVQKVKDEARAAIARGRS